MDFGVAFKVGFFTVRWYGLLIATAVYLGYWLASKKAKAKKQDINHLANILIYGLVLAMVGARLYYVAFNWQFYRHNLFEIIAVWHGGLAIHGGLIGGLLAALLYTRKQKLNFWLWADITAPSLILGQAIGRWGNYFNQEAFGYPTKLPWAIYISPEKRPVQFKNFAYFHPTFFYESVWNFFGFLLLTWLFSQQQKQPQKYPTGTVFLAYLIYYSLGRFFIEGLRTDSLMLGPLRIAQVVSLALIGFVAIFWYRRLKA